MSKISEIQQAILRLEGGKYQRLMDTYLMHRYKFQNISSLGSQVGTDKTTKGIPDAYVNIENGKYIYIMHGTTQPKPFVKLKGDIESVLAKQKLPLTNISKLICCHASSNITPLEDRQLRSLFPNLELIGIDTLSQDLYSRYPKIAHDFLDINIDTNQIFSYDDFIKQHASTAVPAPLNFALVGRLSETQDITKLLEKENVLILCGKSGIGKTKLAIEVAKEFSDKNGYVLKCVLNNGEEIYSDIISNFPDETNYIILIDDANMLTKINHFIRLATDQSRKYKIKVILTVRDYAKEVLVNKINKYAPFYSEYTLKSLKEEDIKKIVKDNFGFENETLLNKITSISNDNVRIAIIAAKCAKNKDWDKIQNAAQIFDSHYNTTMSDLSDDEKIVAAFIAFFHRIEISKEHAIVSLLEDVGINYNSFLECRKKLQQKEIVDVYNDVAIGFGEQTLGDYLLYYAFEKKKIIPLNKLILKIFPTYRMKIVALLNIILRTFQTSEAVAYIESQLKLAWEEIKKRDEDEQVNFIENFYPIIQDEGLHFLLEKIKSLPDIKTNFFEVGNSSEYLGHIPRFLNILAEYKNSDKFNIALEILMLYIKSKAKYPKLVYDIFEDKLSIDKDSYRLKYQKELLIINTLNGFYKKTKNHNIAITLIRFAGACLKFKQHQDENHGKSISFYDVPIEPIVGAFELRKQAIEAISGLYEEDRFKHLIDSVIYKYNYYGLHELQKPLLEADLKLFSGFVSKYYKSQSFDACLIMEHFYRITKKKNLKMEPVFGAFNTNKFFNLFTAICKDRWSESRTFEEIEKEGLEELKALTSDFSTKDFSLFFNRLKESYLLQQNDHRPDWALDILFKSQEYSKDKYFSFLNVYIEAGTPFLPNGIFSLMERASGIFGFNEVFSFIKNKNFGEKEVFLSCCYIFIPQDLITDEILKEILSLPHKKAKGQNVLLPSLSKIAEIDAKFNGFAYKYFKILISSFKEEPATLKNFLDSSSVRDPNIAKNIVKILSPEEDKKTLQQTYIELMLADKSRYFDHNGYLFKAIYENNKDFINDIIGFAISKYEKHDIFRFFRNVWDWDNYSKILNEVIDRLYALAAGDNKYFISNYLSDVFDFAISDCVDIKKKNFIEDYIKNYKNDAVRIKDFFNAIGFMNFSQKKEFILLLCKVNVSCDLFKEIDFYPRHRSWSGSEGPVIEEEINCLRQIKEELSGGEYLEHRLFLDRIITAREQEKTKILTREFLEEAW